MSSGLFVFLPLGTHMETKQLQFEGMQCQVYDVPELVFKARVAAAMQEGRSDYPIYRREGKNEYLGKFHVVANSARGVDGASETDGLDVVSAPLGSEFPQGLLVVQDGRNLAPTERQNFKYVSWADVMEALQLTRGGKGAC